MTPNKKRLFLAVNLPEDLKREIADEILAGLPKNGLRKVLLENLHVTLQFLGYFPEEGLKELQGKLESVDFECFEAELNCVGHFKGNVIWLGFGKGTEQFNLLNRKLQAALGTHDDRFHAHVTLARNRSLERGEVQGLVEGLREKVKPRVVKVESFELMESELRKPGPKYTVLYSKRL
jgi:2'-5' RNA ligase